MTIRAFDTANQITSVSLDFNLNTIAAGNNGAPCEDHEDCHSGLCATDGIQQLCTESCDFGADTCTGGLVCVAAEAGGGICWPEGDDGGTGGAGGAGGASGGRRDTGCAMSLGGGDGGLNGAGALLVLTVAVLLAWRSRRSGVHVPVRVKLDRRARRGYYLRRSTRKWRNW